MSNNSDPAIKKAGVTCATERSDLLETSMTSIHILVSFPFEIDVITNMPFFISIRASMANNTAPANLGR